MKPVRWYQPAAVSRVRDVKAANLKPHQGQQPVRTLTRSNSCHIEKSSWTTSAKRIEYPRLGLSQDRGCRQKRGVIDRTRNGCSIGQNAEICQPPFVSQLLDSCTLTQLHRPLVRATIWTCFVPFPSPVSDLERTVESRKRRTSSLARGHVEAGSGVQMEGEQ